MSLIIGKKNIMPPGSLIYECGDEVTSISYIINGKVLKESDYGDETLNEGDFLASSDLYEGFYTCEYTAISECEIMVFSADNGFSLIDFLSNNAAIHLEFSKALCKFMKLLYKDYSILYNEVSNIYQSVFSMHGRYINCCDDSEIIPTKFLMPHDATLFKFEDQDFYKSYSLFTNLLSDSKNIYDVFNSGGEKLLKVQLDSLKGIYTSYEDMIFYLKTEVALFASNSNESLFCIASMLMEKAPFSVRADIMNLLTDMKNVISDIDESIKRNTGINLDIDYNRVNFYFMMAQDLSLEKDTNVSDESASLKASNLSEELLDKNKNIENEFSIDLYNSLHNICSYAEYFPEREAQLDKYIHTYLTLPDKTSRDDDVRNFRKAVNEAYFNLYEIVFLKYASEGIENKIIELFLDFGFLDERLLTDYQLEFLLSIPEINNDGRCKVYRMKDWLLSIYNGINMPSKNEFDIDYTEMVRIKKARENLSSADEVRLLNDSIQKVKYEINNMLRNNIRLLSPNITAFFPVLNMDNFEKDIKNLVLTSEDINAAIKACTDIDYSAFYREQMYENLPQGISKTLIQIEALPDIILFPLSGVNGLMWQELSGRKSNSSGRFFLPSFFDGKIDDVMISLIGRFRWELCKSSNGSAWNNISVPSLTSEYADYIQFFRKNRDLSSDKKEALKLQLGRCRNNMREVFTTDYFIWIKFESSGAVRLNKVSRKILSTYCPFSKEYRDKLNKIPMFEESMKRYNLEKAKKLKEWSVKVRNLNNANITPPQEIQNTIRFYMEF